ATAFEEPAPAVARLRDAGLPVVKSQVSAALHVADPASAPARALLADYVEGRLLQQVRAPSQAGGLGWGVAPGRAERDPLPGREPWRIHYHLPLHSAPRDPLGSTAAELTESLRELVGGEHPLTDHLEVETYTWTVLPADQRPADDAGLVTGIAAELRYAR